MAKKGIDKLFRSLHELEEAISGAENAITNKGGTPPEELLDRINSYHSILGKQRKLADELREHMHAGRQDDVLRCVNLMNGLSGLIRSDAKEILDILATGQKAVPDAETYLC